MNPERIDKSRRWGTMMGPIPADIRRRALRGDRQLNNRPLYIVHNHEIGKARIQYAGYCPTAPTYHIFLCVALSDPPRRKIKLTKFDITVFTTDSKAGKGGCSMRFCPGEAVMMSVKENRAYCERCTRLVRGTLPCSWTSIHLCERALGMASGPYDKPCSLCVSYEEATS